MPLTVFVVKPATLDDTREETGHISGKGHTQAKAIKTAILVHGVKSVNHSQTSGTNEGEEDHQYQADVLNRRGYEGKRFGAFKRYWYL